MLLLELSVALSIVIADPKDFDLSLLINPVIVPDPTGLFNSARGIIFRIEIDDHILSPEIREGECGSSFVLQCKVRRKLSS